jgi:hypothetical protein
MGFNPAFKGLITLVQWHVKFLQTLQSHCSSLFALNQAGATFEQLKVLVTFHIKARITNIKHQKLGEA